MTFEVMADSMAVLILVVMEEGQRHYSFHIES